MIAIVKKILKGFAFFILLFVSAAVIMSYFNILPHPPKPQKSGRVCQTEKTTPEIPAIKDKETTLTVNVTQSAQKTVPEMPVIKDNEVPIIIVAVQVAPTTEKQEEKITSKTAIMSVQRVELVETETKETEKVDLEIEIPAKREIPIETETVLATKTMQMPLMEDEKVVLTVVAQGAPVPKKQEEKITKAELVQPVTKTTEKVDKIIVRELKKPGYQNHKFKKRGFIVYFKVKANKMTLSRYGKQKWWGERNSYCLAGQNQINQALVKHPTSVLQAKIAYKNQK